MGIGGLQMAGAFNSAMSGLSTVAGVATRAGQIAGFAQKFMGASGGGGVPSGVSQSAVYAQGSGTVSMALDDEIGGIASTSSITIPRAQKGQKRQVYLKMKGVGGMSGGGAPSGI